MNLDKKKRLQADGWVVGDADDFLKHVSSQPKKTGAGKEINLQPPLGKVLLRRRELEDD